MGSLSPVHFFRTLNVPFALSAGKSRSICVPHPVFKGSFEKPDGLVSVIDFPVLVPREAIHGEFDKVAKHAVMTSHAMPVANLLV